MLTKIAVLGSVCLLLGSMAVTTHAAPRLKQGDPKGTSCGELYMPPVCGEQSLLADQDWGDGSDGRDGQESEQESEECE